MTHNALLHSTAKPTTLDSVRLVNYVRYQYAPTKNEACMKRKKFKELYMMNQLIKSSVVGAILVFGTLIFNINQATAGIYTSDQVIANQQHQFNKQQVLAFVDDAQVQNKLIALGVSPADAQLRIASMTNAELEVFNSQLNEMPAGGVVGVIVTVLVVVAVLDLMGITNVYPFIRPVGS